MTFIFCTLLLICNSSNDEKLRMNHEFAQHRVRDPTTAEMGSFMVNVDQLIWSQRNVHMNFSDGTSLLDNIYDLWVNPERKSELPDMKVIPSKENTSDGNGKYFVIEGNRRLKQWKILCTKAKENGDVERIETF